MAYIGELIEGLVDEEGEGNVESLKKLIYLAVNETSLLEPQALPLAQRLCPVLDSLSESTSKIYALQLLAELATNYQPLIPADTYDFEQVVELLSDENVSMWRGSPRCVRRRTTFCSSS